MTDHHYWCSVISHQTIAKHRSSITRAVGFHQSLITISHQSSHLSSDIRLSVISLSHQRQSSVITSVSVWSPLISHNPSAVNRPQPSVISRQLSVISLLLRHHSSVSKSVFTSHQFCQPVRVVNDQFIDIQSSIIAWPPASSHGQQ